jgi:hypothetical protein
VIYFLQVDPEVKMPCFPVKEFTGKHQVPDVARVPWWCPLALPMLMARFFEFYAGNFLWGYEVVSVRNGQRQCSTDAVFSQLPSSKGVTMIHIEDPFILHRNLNCVLGWEQNSLLRQKMTSAIQTVKMCKVPFGFFAALNWCKEMQHNQASDEATQASVPPGLQGALSGSDSGPGGRKALTTNGTLSGDNPQSGTNASLRSQLSAGGVPNQGMAKAKVQSGRAAAGANPTQGSRPPDAKSLPMPKSPDTKNVPMAKFLLPAEAAATAKAKSKAAVQVGQRLNAMLDDMAQGLAQRDPMFTQMSNSQAKANGVAAEQYRTSAAKATPPPAMPKMMAPPAKVADVPKAKADAPRSSGPGESHLPFDQEPPRPDELPFPNLGKPMTWSL